MSDTVAGTASLAGISPRKASAEDLPTVSETLALAFYDDPVVSWCVPDGMRRRELLPSFFGAITDSYSAYDAIYAVEDSTSAAVWAPPGAEDDEELPSVIEAILGDDVERAFMVMGLMEEKHPTDPHHYLFLLGTRPEWQGRGLGSAVIGPVLEMCDRDGTPAYLEASSERNKRLYLRHGFEVTGEINIPDGPTMWPMWRDPR